MNPLEELECLNQANDILNRNNSLLRQDVEILTAERDELRAQLARTQYTGGGLPTDLESIIDLLHLQDGDRVWLNKAQADVLLKLRAQLAAAKCPNNCDNGAIPYGSNGDGWEFEQCQWCAERDELRAQLAAFRAREMVGCDAGCQPFSCGSIKHLQTCPNYPESYSRMIDELRAQLLEREPYVQHLETCDTWLFGSCDCGLDELLASHKEQSK